jgi:hypothetical protein
MGYRPGRRRLIVLTGLALAAAGCGGGHHTTTVESAPSIDNLHVTVLTPLIQGQTGVYEFQADFFDPDADLDGGSCGIDSSIGSSEVRLDAVDAVSGTVVCRFSTIVSGRVANGVFFITDRHGNVSNGLGFTIPAERPRTG